MTVSARGRDGDFLGGPAVAEAQAIIRGRGGYEEEQGWTRSVAIEVTP